ncbi:MAG: response regulator [Clostridiales bacterium]|nr:response regulator [Clostridiales bacterium]
MHIAICDDNVADRKLLERILSRESDKRTHTTGGFQISSFGNSASLLNSAAVYDLFFIDMCHGTESSVTIIEKLRNSGISAPIFLCSSIIDYEGLSLEFTNLFYLKKPLQPLILSENISSFLQNQAPKKPKLELRDEKQTYYIPAEEVVWIEKKNANLILYTTDSKTISVIGDFNDIHGAIEVIPDLMMTTNKRAINLAHIIRLTPFTMVLSSGVRFRIFPGEYFFIKRYLNFRKAYPDS